MQALHIQPVDPLGRTIKDRIVFELPDEDEREHLWQRLISAAAAPLAGDLDLARLTRDFPKMSGANIRNAALAAAFLAAADGRGTIDQETVIAAGRGEYLSMGQVLSTNRR